VSVHCYVLNQEHQTLPSCTFSIVIRKHQQICGAVLWMVWIGRSWQQSSGSPSHVNSFVEVFLRSGKFIRNQEVQSVRLAIHESPGIDLGTQNRPTCSEVVAILLDDNTGAERDIISHQQGGGVISN